jgi:hypothetical protein
MKIDNKLAEHYGAHYFSPESTGMVKKCRDGDLYYYESFSGDCDITVANGDSVITLSPSGDTAMWIAGTGHAVRCSKFAVLLRGYSVGEKTCSLKQRTNLPYVNGCSTRQLFPPERVGDPTLQQLTIPPYTSEQAHHIHSTVRVVYVASGSGYSIVGQSDSVTETKLIPGMLCVLDPMSPHHFRTENDWLTVLPVHVFSSVGAIENNHPMFNGTYKIDT